MSADPPEPTRADLGAGPVPPPTTRAALTDLVEHCAHLTLERGAHQRIRARLLPDGGYELEYRADEADFQLYTPDPILVRDILWSWLDGTNWWRRTPAWFPLDPAVAELTALRGELTDFLNEFAALGEWGTTLDAALARADELLSGE
ncbi:hypothetical protein D5S18_20225 [Nocardia panacis]|uniref:Uncharacterized protein n=1 Tax=Nocardia panacis TaxID=2340916 RepID=A0A3A4KIL8_9NOCA|nr:hypothetical protein [Nocardia panacis]RJO73533.1 hypothetical protein D5S18_20225 [Nocardia panacis]